MIQLFQQSKSSNAGNFHAHVGNVWLRCCVVNDADEFIGGMIKLLFPVSAFNTIVQNYLDAVLTEFFGHR